MCHEVGDERQKRYPGAQMGARLPRSTLAQDVSRRVNLLRSGCMLRGLQLGCKCGTTTHCRQAACATSSRKYRTSSDYGSTAERSGSACAGIWDDRDCAPHAQGVLKAIGPCLRGLPMLRRRSRM